MRGITGRTRVYAVLGDPVAHSRSPLMQNAALRALDLDGVYVALRVDTASVEAAMRALAGAGGGGNVTLPHKARALAAADRVLPAARRTGAANTFWQDGDDLVVDNTDVEGVARALPEVLPEGPLDRAALVLGAGGAARAAALALLDGGARQVVIHNRTASRAIDLVRDLGDSRLVVSGERGSPSAVEVAVVINATRLGLSESDALPLAMSDLMATGTGAVLDLVYGDDPTGTPWVRAARRAGLAAADGRGMLLHQGARAFEHWWGRPAPLEAMRTALAGGDVG